MRANFPTVAPVLAKRSSAAPVSLGTKRLGFAGCAVQAAKSAKNSLRPRNIGVREIAAFEEEPRAVRLGAGVGQAVAEIQAGPVLAAFAVALECGDRDMGDLLGDGHDVNGALPQQRGDL